MFWEKSGELFRCLPLIDASGEEQLQFMYDIASVNEGGVDVPMLTARYAFLRSTSSVGAIMRNGKALGGADVEKLLSSYKPSYSANSCDGLIKYYCDNKAVYEICDCCPCSSTYKNKNRKEEFEVLAYILSNGGPVYVDLQDLGIDDLSSLVKSQEPVPFGKVANKFVPYPLFQKVAEYMIESAFACVSADAFWEGFSGVVYSRKAKQYKYGKIDETALSYIKNIVYSLFDDRYKDLNLEHILDSLRVLMGSTSVGSDVLEAAAVDEPVNEPSVEPFSKPIAITDSLSVSDGVEHSSDMPSSSVIISETDELVVLGSFFDEPAIPANVGEPVESGDVARGVVEEDAKEEVEGIDNDIVEDYAETVPCGVPDGVSAGDENESFLAVSDARQEDTSSEVGDGASLVGGLDLLGGRSEEELSCDPVDTSIPFTFKPQANSVYDEADDEVMCSGFLLKKKKGMNLDVLPVRTGRRVSGASNDSVPKPSATTSLFERITGHSFNAAGSSEAVNEHSFERVEVAFVRKGCFVEGIEADELPPIINECPEPPCCKNSDEEFVVAVNPVVENVSDSTVSKKVDIRKQAKFEKEAGVKKQSNEVKGGDSKPVIQLYREVTNDGMIEPIEFRESKYLCPGTILIYNKEVGVVKDSNSKDFLDFCRAIEGASDVPIEVAKVGDEVGLLVLLERMYFVTYNSDAYGILHSFFANKKCRKICFDAYVLARYVYMYDSVLENVCCIFQYSSMGVDIATVSGLEDYVSFVQKQGDVTEQARAEYFAYMAAHALSSDVGHYINASFTSGPDGFKYDLKSVVGVGERSYGAVFELSGFSKDVDSGIGFDRIALNSIRVLFYSHIIHKYNLKIVDVGTSSIKIYAPYNIYEVLDMLILAFSNSIKQLTGGVPSFVCVPSFVKKPTVK